MGKAPRENRIPIMFSAEELRAVDDWRFAHRIATRADAVRRLCRNAIGLDVELNDIADGVDDIFDFVLDRAGIEREIFIKLSRLEELSNSTASLTPSLIVDGQRQWITELLNYLEDLRLRVIAVNNRVTLMSNAKSIKGGELQAARSEKDIINRFQEIEERELEMEENRKISFVAEELLSNPTARSAYNAMSDEEQGAYLEKRMADLGELPPARSAEDMVREILDAIENAMQQRKLHNS